MHGIEINPYAAELAQVVIWIGYLQWLAVHGIADPKNGPHPLGPNWQCNPEKIARGMRFWI